MNPQDIRAALAAELTLHDTLARLGLDHARVGPMYQHAVTSADGAEVFRGDAGAVWAWLRSLTTPVAAS